jgi:hypothetical protein
VEGLEALGAVNGAGVVPAAVEAAAAGAAFAGAFGVPGLAGAVAGMRTET